MKIEIEKIEKLLDKIVEEVLTNVKKIIAALWIAFGMSLLVFILMGRFANTLGISNTTCLRMFVAVVVVGEIAIWGTIILLIVNAVAKK